VEVTIHPGCRCIFSELAFWPGTLGLPSGAGEQRRAEVNDDHGHWRRGGGGVRGGAGECGAGGAARVAGFFVVVSVE